MMVVAWSGGFETVTLSSSLIPLPWALRLLNYSGNVDWLPTPKLYRHHAKAEIRYLSYRFIE